MKKNFNNQNFEWLFDDITSTMPKIIFVGIILNLCHHRSTKRVFPSSSFNAFYPCISYVAVWQIRHCIY
jgi:hypothetical protein